MVVSTSRIDDMLRIYGDKAVQAEQDRAAKHGQTLGNCEIQSLRRRAECRAWVIHDSYFVWRKPLSNTFDELKSFMTDDGDRFAPTDWQTLKSYTVARATGFLGRMTHTPCPVLLSETHRIRWWQYMAIIHECDRQLGNYCHVTDQF